MARITAAAGDAGFHCAETTKTWRVSQCAAEPWSTVCVLFITTIFLEIMLIIRCLVHIRDYIISIEFNKKKMDV